LKFDNGVSECKINFDGTNLNTTCSLGDGFASDSLEVRVKTLEDLFATQGVPPANGETSCNDYAANGETANGVYTISVAGKPETSKRTLNHLTELCARHKCGRQV
jgi:hypothetical protein